MLVATIAGLAAFGLTGSPWPAAALFVAVSAVRRASVPVFTAWINHDLDLRNRATMNSVAEQAWSIGEVAGGPTLGPIAKATSVSTSLVTAAFVQIPSLAVLAIRHRQRRGRNTRVPAPTA